VSECGGIYYDGRQSAQRDVTVSFRADGIRIHGPGIDVSYPAEDAEATPKVGRLRRSLRFRDGGVCEVGDASLLEDWLARHGKRDRRRLLHRIETKMRYVLPVIILTVAAVAALVDKGIPWLARRAAFALPAATEKLIGQEALEILDRAFLAPSGLPAGRREEIGRLFRRMTAGLSDAGKYRIEFRSGKATGANAFALPPGIVVLTDELVLLARHDEEIAAVIAHEIGHIRHRHILRQVLQDSAAGLLIASLSGDVTSVTSLSAALPAVIVHARFSRDFEREADDTALVWLRENGIPPSRFADLLERLEGGRRERQGVAGGRDGSAIADFLSTHPVTEERVRRFRNDPFTSGRDG
jgi:Zn-dependent protease with chaperone function